MKTCSKCRVPKPLEDFQRDRSRRDGHEHRCRECNNARYREKYDSLTGVEFNRLILRRRRTKALARIKQRQEV